MKELKLIAIDVDGTLLTDEHELTERTRSAILEMKERGVRVILATGRSPKSCLPFVDEMCLTEPMITHNGAVIYHPITKEVELEIGYRAEELLPFIQFCRQHKLQFDLNTALEMYIEHATPEAEKIYEQFFITPSVVEDSSRLEQQVVKFTIAGTSKELDRVMENLAPDFPDWSFIRSGEMFIDIIHPKATKGFALQQIMKKMNIQPESVLAFGNYFNDLEMLEVAGTGVAMGNSPVEVKVRADRVTRSNNDSGVAIVLEEWLEKQKQ